MRSAAEMEGTAIVATGWVKATVQVKSGGVGDCGVWVTVARGGEVEMEESGVAI